MRPICEGFHRTEHNSKMRPISETLNILRHNKFLNSLEFLIKKQWLLRAFEHFVISMSGKQKGLIGIQLRETTNNILTSSRRSSMTHLDVFRFN